MSSGKDSVKGKRNAWVSEVSGTWLEMKAKSQGVGSVEGKILKSVCVWEGRSAKAVEIWGGDNGSGVFLESKKCRDEELKQRELEKREGKEKK